MDDKDLSPDHPIGKCYMNYCMRCMRCFWAERKSIDKCERCN